jgi:hypothetical protein
MTSRFDAGKRALGPVALFAAAALAFALVAGPAAQGEQPGASIAKKCGKKKGNAAASGKKKKCKKKKKAAQPKPVVRATLSWAGADSADADLDLFVFDASGNRAGNGSDAIPQSVLSSDASGLAGTETFTDNTGGKRVLSFAVCYQVGGSAHAPFTITYTTADGVPHTESRDPGSSFHYDFPGGAPIPAGYCPD